MPKKKKTASTMSFEERLDAIRALKKLPTAVVVSSLPDLISPEGSALPIETKTGIVRALVAGMVDDTLLEMIHARTNEDSRDALAFALLAFWEEKEFHGRYEWVLAAIAALGGDRTMLALAAHVAAWPNHSDSGRKRAIATVPMFVTAGTNAALLALVGLRQTVVAPSVVEAVIRALDRAVKKRKTTLSELLDEITPTLGLDATGTRTLDYGARRFTIAFDDHFEPHLRDENDVPVTDLPTPNAAWATISADLREAVKVQTYRLEQDMINRRRWTTSAWTHRLKEHPLLVSFTRRIVWGIYDDDDRLIVAFRTAEDQSLVGRDDTEVHLEPNARIGVAHAIDLGHTACADWSQSFADYEIIQPFAQLGRTVHDVPEDQRESTSSDFFAKEHFKSGVLRDVLVRKGWERDPSLFRKFYERLFADDKIIAIARLDPGVDAGSASYDVADQRIPIVEFKTIANHMSKGREIALEDVPPIVFSEALVDLAEILAEQDSLAS